MIDPVANIVVRGKVISSDLVEFGGRGGNFGFKGPDPQKYVDQLPLSTPGGMADLYDLKFDDILDYLDELGKRLNVNTNEHMQRARELTYDPAPMTPPLVDSMYESFPPFMARDNVRQIAEQCVGIEYLEGWVEHRLLDGTRIDWRAFGSRGLHIIAGNGPFMSVLSLVRSAITRSDCIIKSPSNDPFTGPALGMTMCEMAPNHPITKHYAVAYWRGGDSVVEERLYKPQFIEKITAWGGLAGVKHVTKYIQPGLELITLDPKRSISIIGVEVLGSEDGMREAARRLATDVGAANQLGCSTSRVAYVLGASSPEDQERVNRLGEMVYDQLMSLPSGYSTKPKSYDPKLKSHVKSLRAGADDWYNVVGGNDDEGCVIVSQLAAPVDFAEYLTDRTVNIVPAESLSDVLRSVDAYTQTVGVWPEELKSQFKNILPYYGVQRFVTLGNASYPGPFYGPHDAKEPVRRMCKWISNEVNEMDQLRRYINKSHF